VHDLNNTSDYDFSRSISCSHHTNSLLLFDWRTLAVIQAFACLAISIFVNLALLQTPELYGLRPDETGPTPASQKCLAAPAHEVDGLELDGASDGVSASKDDSASSSGPEPPNHICPHSGGQVDAAAACKDELGAPDSDPTANQNLEGLTVRESLRRPIFWLIILSIFFIDVLWGGFNLHFVSVLEDQGLGRTSGASTFLATSIAAALSSLLCGPFFDRLPVGMKVRNLCFSALLPLFFLAEFKLYCSIEASPLPLVAGCLHWFVSATAPPSRCNLRGLFQASIYMLASPNLAWLIGVFYGVLDSFSFIGVGVAMSDSFGRAHLAKLMSITR
jgi:hypothetical protein